MKSLDQFPALFVICLSASDPATWKFAEKIRTNKSLRSFPILFIGENVISELDTENAVRFYAQGILARPLNVEVVKREIERILQRTI